MVIPDEIKQQLLYHFPNSKIKILHGLFYNEEIQALGPRQFFYGKIDKSNFTMGILHFDGKIRTVNAYYINTKERYLVKFFSSSATCDPHLGYLIEMI